MTPSHTENAGGEGRPFTFLSLFSGIGGLDLGLERAGMKCVGQVEIDPFCRAVLAKHWPDVPKFEDVRSFTRESIDGEIDCIAGGFPCQDVSYAGLGAGLTGERSGLWSEMLRIVCEFRPQYVVVENVSALLNRGIGKVLADLADSGFDAEWRLFTAAEFGAPHRRQRLFIVAYTNQSDGQARVGTQQERQKTVFTKNPGERLAVWLQAPPECGRVDHGIPARFYEGRVGGLGNAVVPQVAEFIGRAILAHDSSLVSPQSIYQAAH